MGMNPYKIRRLTKLVLIQALLITVTITCLFPLFWMVRSSLMTQDAVFVDQSIIPSRLHFGNYVRAWTQGQFGRYFLNSVVYTTIVVFGIVVISSWAAYAFSRLKFPGRKLFFVLFILAVM
ncbi:MAG TPA: carbohydrate ABC transporter permease, partial [Candidatus Omnitrophota bacterium]|nr:carbohydrate ABC transporter permease [Candidatus Omnitrophota bacterium]